MSYKPRYIPDEADVDDGMIVLKLHDAGPRTPEELDELIRFLQECADEATCEREGAYKVGDTITFEGATHTVESRGVSRYGLIDKRPHITYRIGTRRFLFHDKVKGLV